MPNELGMLMRQFTSPSKEDVMTADKRIEEFRVKHATDRFEEKVEEMATRLERAAEELRRDAKSVVETPDTSWKISGLERASWIVNQLNHLTQHLAGQDLMMRAAELDTARDAVETDEA